MVRVAVIAAVLAIGSIPAQAGYVRSWSDARGGCKPGLLRLLDPSTSSGDRIFLDKPTAQWTDEDFDDYRAVYTECAHRFPAFTAGIGNDPGNIKIDRFLTERFDEAYAFTVGRAKQERQAAIAAEDARRDLSRSQAAAKREGMLEDARRDRERAEAARKLANEEAPLIAEAEGRYAEAVRERAEAERRLEAVRGRVQEQERKRSEEETKRIVALEQQQHIETEARLRSKEAELAGRPCSITQEQFDRIRYGMSLHDVQIALGCLGRQTGGMRIVGVGVFTDYAFEGADGVARVGARFKGRSLERKEQYGLD